MARDPKTVEHHMQRLQAIGIRFSLDDFGTGYSLISRLRQFPFNELKIDGLFVADIAHQAEAQSLGTAILNIADAPGLQTAAEHVSTNGQLELLASLGCKFFQSFLFSRSLPIKDFELPAGANNPSKAQGNLKSSVAY